MKLNQDTAVSTSAVLLVPYDRRHVLRYHGWMKDPATASEPLTLDEEYENQLSWRTSRDKLTFIVCRPATGPPGHIVAGAADAPPQMFGDVNLFLYPGDEPGDCVAEVDVMVAEAADRGRGVGRATVAAFLQYVVRNADAILAEYAGDGAAARPGLTGFMAKIKEGNEGSKALFRSLGFAQQGRANYFGELTMTLDLDQFSAKVLAYVPDGYAEVEYSRGNDGER